ncbi:MAG: hypothetical protein VX460_01520 [Planctomycetota bacterium]|nr:hypothetical protein [Planctomycetota bacterium]
MERAVVFVAPFALESTLRFVHAAAALPGVRLTIVCQEAEASFLAKAGEDTARLVSAVVRCPDVHDVDALEVAVRAAAAGSGGRVDALIGILEPLQVPMAEVRARLGVRGMDPAEARGFRDKAHMKELLRESGLPCAAHLLATDPESALAFARRTLPLVAKPPAGAGAKDTFRVDTIDQLAEWMRRHPPGPGAPLLLEEFVQGDEFSFDTVSVGGHHVFHSISEYAPTPLQVMESPWIQWTVLLPRGIDGPEFAAIHVAGPRALDALGMVTGMTHMEWFRRADGSIAISEVAARPPGAHFTSLISHAHGADMYSAWAEVSCFERFTAPKRRYSTGAAYLRGQGVGRVTGVAGLDRARAELGDLVVEAKIPPPGTPKASGYEGEGHVILRHEDTDRVREGLRRVVQILQVELAAH